MRRLLAVCAVALTLALGLAAGGARFGSYSAHVSGHSHLLADGASPNGWTCGGSVGTPC